MSDKVQSSRILSGSSFWTDLDLYNCLWYSRCVSQGCQVFSKIPRLATCQKPPTRNQPHNFHHWKKKKKETYFFYFLAFDGKQGECCGQFCTIVLFSNVVTYFTKEMLLYINVCTFTCNFFPNLVKTWQPLLLTLLHALYKTVGPALLPHDKPINIYQCLIHMRLLFKTESKFSNTPLINSLRNFLKNKNNKDNWTSVGFCSLVFENYIKH